MKKYSYVLGNEINEASNREGTMMITIDFFKETLDEADRYVSRDKALVKYPFSTIELDKFKEEDWLHPIEDLNGNSLYPKIELDDIIEKEVESNYLTAEEVELQFPIDKDMIDQMDRMGLICATQTDDGVWLYNKEDILHVINRLHDGIHCLCSDDAVKILEMMSFY